MKIVTPFFVILVSKKVILYNYYYYYLNFVSFSGTLTTIVAATILSATISVLDSIVADPHIQIFKYSNSGISIRSMDQKRFFK